MFKILKVFLVCLLFFSIYLSSAQSGIDNKVFAKAMARCCNNAICHDEPCSSASSILPCTGDEYLSNCLLCMGVLSELRSCGRYNDRYWPTWRLRADGTKYYAEEY